MNAIAINDLSLSNDLDRAAMTTITGRGEWHQNSASVVQGSWSGYTQRYKIYIGQKFHDGYLSKETAEGWQRTKTDVEYSTWSHFVRV
jgi:hypothetical protein